MKRFGSILVVVLIAAAASKPEPVSGKPRKKDGNYNLVVAGMFKGNGTAVMGGSKLRLSANVTDDNGLNGELNVNVDVSKDNHFKGSGNVIGQQARFTGRLDAPDDAKERAIKGVRITCSFKTADGRYGRIMGWVDGDKRMPLDDDRGRGGRNGRDRE